MRVWSLGWEDPLEEGMATHSGIPAWRIPWTEESAKLQSMGSWRVRRDWSGLAHMHALIISPLITHKHFPVNDQSILTSSLKLSFTPPPTCFLPASRQGHYHPLIHPFIPLSIIKVNKHFLNPYYVANTGLIIEESKTSKNWSFVL